MTDTILANATLVLPTETLRGQVRLSGGQIAGIADGAGVPQGAIDCEGDLVMPGLVELHTDNLERHIQPRPRVDWPHGAGVSSPADLFVTWHGNTVELTDAAGKPLGTGAARVDLPRRQGRA